MLNDHGKKKFKEFAKANRLRIKRDKDGLPIIVARGKKYEGWHLYEGFGDDFVGLYITRPTTAKTKYSLRKLRKMGFYPLREGDFEAIFKIPYSRAWEVAKEFGMVKKKPSNQNMSGLNNWRKQKDREATL
jgi:hypothetical protein